MPLYRFITPPESTTADQRAAVADAVTRIHCDLTGAPPTFVHVFFSERADGDTGHMLHAVHRAGRSADVKAELLRQASTAFASIVGIDNAAITAHLDEAPAKWIMEGGAVLPEPGDEASWLEANHAHAPLS